MKSELCTNIKNQIPSGLVCAERAFKTQILDFNLNSEALVFVRVQSDLSAVR